MAKKQVLSTQQPKSYALVIPDYSALKETEIKDINALQFKCIFVLENYNNSQKSDPYIDLKEKSIGEIEEKLKETNVTNIIQIGTAKNLAFAFNEAKKHQGDFAFVGEKESKKKGSKLERIFYETSTQLATNINKYGSHTETAIYSKQLFIDILKKEGPSIYSSFIKLASRAVEYGYSLESIGSFDNISVANPAKKLFQNFILFFTEKWNYFAAQPIADLKSKKDFGNSEHSIYRLLLFSLVLISIVILPILSTNYGATWDEKLHIDYGREVVNEFPDGWFDNTIYEKKIHAIDGMKPYSASFDVICAFISDKVPGIGIYELRHFFNTFFGILLFLFAALIAREFGGWRAAFITFLLILFSPSIFGHIFNNPKDIPFATGYALGLLYLIRYFKELPSPSLKTKVMLTLGIALSISIRPPGIILVAFFGMVLLVHWLFYLSKENKKRGVIKYALQFIGVSITGYILGILLWPYGLQDPINNPLEALTTLSNFSSLTAYQIFEGVRQYIKPWYYGPKLILLTTPIIAILGMALGFLGFIKLKGKQRLLYAFLLFVAIFPIAYSIYKDSYLYNGWRHFLFIYAPLMVFSGVGFEFLLRIFNQKIGKIIVFGLLILGIGKVVIWQVQNHPYEYMYYNEIAGGTHEAAGDYETDYWCQTPKEAIKWLAENEVKGDKKIRVKSNNETNSLQYYANKYSDSIQILWTRENQWQEGQWDYAIWTTRTLSKSQIENKATWPPKGTIHTIDVDGFPMAAIVKRETDFAMNGIDAMAKKNYALALAELQKAYEYDPNEEEVVRRIGMVYKATGNFTEAVKFLDKARILKGENYEALEAIGEIKLAQSDRERQLGNAKGANDFKEEAKAYFLKTIEHKINFSAAYYYLGNIYLTDGFYIDAINNFDKFIERQPAAPQGYLLKARAQISLSSFKEAEKTLLMAINGYGIKEQQLFLLLAEIYKKQGNAQAAQQVLDQMPK
jgi:tetratricopeptide (TPR) repeat protein